MSWREISSNTAPDALVFPSERGTYLSRDNFLRRNIHKKLEDIGLGWVNFQVLRRTQASLGHKEGVDPKVAAERSKRSVPRGHQWQAGRRTVDTPISALAIRLGEVQRPVSTYPHRHPIACDISCVEV